MKQLELFSPKDTLRTEPFRLLCCHRCAKRWLTPDHADSGATFAVCPACGAVVRREGGNRGRGDDAPEHYAE